MTSKTKIFLLNHNKFHVSHLLRHFQQAIQLTNSGEYLQPLDIFRVLDSMGYLCAQKSEKDYELISSLTHMLADPKGQGIVIQRNLFYFLMIINSLHGNVDQYFEKQVQALPKDIVQLQEPLIQIDIGNFTQQGIWQVSRQEEIKLKQIFSNMIYTKMSRQQIITNKKENQSNRVDQFKPKILNKSVIMAQNRMKKLNFQRRVQNRLLQGRDQFNNRIFGQIQASQQKQVKQCTFKPKINSKSKRLKKEDHSFSKGQNLLQKGRQYDLRRKMHQQEYEQYKSSLQLSQCSFHPDLSSSTSSLRQSLRREFNPTVKNQQKSVERVKIARQQRESLNQVNRRGYPQGKSWVNFMEEVRTKRCSTTTFHNKSMALSQKPIIFTMDLKILGQRKHVQVKQADDILEMTQRICQNHHFNSSSYQKVYEIIQKTLRQSGQALIKNGKVFLLNRK